LPHSSRQLPAPSPALPVLFQHSHLQQLTTKAPSRSSLRLPRLLTHGDLRSASEKPSSSRAAARPWLMKLQPRNGNPVPYLRHHPRAVALFCAVGRGCSGAPSVSTPRSSISMDTGRKAFDEMSVKNAVASEMKSYKLEVSVKQQILDWLNSSIRRLCSAINF
jgi:hypothetical protein